MLKVGLTGGIGCGKSTAVDAFRVLGITIIDADQIAKEIVQPDTKALKLIKETFGEKVLLESGELNRAYLKKIIFNDPEALEKLENILHPIIRDEIEKQIAFHHEEPYIIVDVPLLVEKNYQVMFDRIIVVDCLPEQQIQRTIQRDNLDQDSIERIINTQASREHRLKSATDILDNTQDKNSLLDQIKDLHQQFMRLTDQ